MSTMYWSLTGAGEKKKSKAWSLLLRKWHSQDYQTIYSYFLFNVVSAETVSGWEFEADYGIKKDFLEDRMLELSFFRSKLNSV